MLASEFCLVCLSSAFTLVLQQSGLMEPLAMWLKRVSRYRHMYSGQAQRPKTLIHRWSFQHDQSQWIFWLASMVHHNDPRHPHCLGGRSSLPRAGNNSWWNSSLYRSANIECSDTHTFPRYWGNKIIATKNVPQSLASPLPKDDFRKCSHLSDANREGFWWCSWG